MVEKIKSIIRSGIEVNQNLLLSEETLAGIESAATGIIRCFRNGGKILLCGNGGSAADAQHIAAELSGRFSFDRPPLCAEAIHVNSSFITAVSNDYSYEEAFARYISGFGKPGDVLICISTSGNSPNIVRAITTGKNLGMVTIALTGVSGGKLKPLADILINVPSGITPRIQESHILIGHILCEIIENTIFGNP